MIVKFCFWFILGVILFAGLLSGIEEPRNVQTNGRFYEQMKIAAAKTDSELASVESTLTVPDIKFLIQGEQELLKMRLLREKLQKILLKNRIEFEKEYANKIKELTFQQQELERFFPKTEFDNIINCSVKCPYCWAESGYDLDYSHNVVLYPNKLFIFENFRRCNICKKVFRYQITIRVSTGE